MSKHERCLDYVSLYEFQLVLGGQSHIEKHYMYDSALLCALGKYSLILSKRKFIAFMSTIIE